MRREPPVRIREGLGGKSPRATRLLLGFDGPRGEAGEIKARLGAFLRDHLKLELSPEKTLVTHARTEKARFLGYDVSTFDNPGRRGHGHVTLRIPPQVIEEKAARYMAEGEPVHRPALIGDSDFTIVGRYGQEYRGYTQYYAFAQNRYWLHRLHWVMRTSLLKTLEAKHKSSVTKMAERFTARAINVDFPPDGGRRVRSVSSNPGVHRWPRHDEPSHPSSKPRRSAAASPSRIRASPRSPASSTS